MTFLELARTRRSVRLFTPQPVEKDKIDEILDTANLAPSAGNLQAYDIYLVTRTEVKQALAGAALGQEFLAQAPLCLVFCANPSRNAFRYRERGARLYAVQDATIACAYAMLAVADLGLATVWVGAFDNNAVRAAIGVSQDLTPIGILPIGYPAEQPAFPGRRSLQEHLHRIE